MKKVFFLLVILALGTLAVACAQATGQAPSGPNTVKLLSASFAATTLSIHKGETITFYDDPNQGSLHILVIGTGGQQVSEKGAPDFGGAAGERLDMGDSWTTPPWNTAGTFHVTCTAHPATMNLVVTVI